MKKTKLMTKIFSEDTSAIEEVTAGVEKALEEGTAETDNLKFAEVDGTVFIEDKENNEVTSVNVNPEDSNDLQMAAIEEVVPEVVAEVPEVAAETVVEETVAESVKSFAAISNPFIKTIVDTGLKQLEMVKENFSTLPITQVYIPRIEKIIAELTKKITDPNAEVTVASEKSFSGIENPDAAEAASHKMMGPDELKVRYDRISTIREALADKTITLEAAQVLLGELQEISEELRIAGVSTFSEPEEVTEVAEVVAEVAPEVAPETVEAIAEAVTEVTEVVAESETEVAPEEVTEVVEPEAEVVAESETDLNGNEVTENNPESFDKMIEPYGTQSEETTEPQAEEVELAETDIPEPLVDIEAKEEEKTFSASTSIKGSNAFDRLFGTN